MKHSINVISIIILILFLSGCASTTTPITPFKYEYPEARLSPSANSSIAIVYPEDERWQDYENDRIWSNDPIEELGEVIQAEMKSTGLFREVLTFNKEDKDGIVESGARVVLYTSVLLLAWDVPFPPERDDFLPMSSRGRLSSTSFTDLYGKVKILFTLVDQDTGQNLIVQEYYSSVWKTMAYFRTDLYGERKKVIGQALKKVMWQFKDNLQQLSNEGRL